MMPQSAPVKFNVKLLCPDFSPTQAQMQASKTQSRTEEKGKLVKLKFNDQCERYIQTYAPAEMPDSDNPESIYQ